MAFLLFFLSGAAALVYEVVWTRSITNVFGGTSAAIATVLAAFMAGLALGGQIFGRWSDRRERRWLRVYALLEAAIGGCALLVPLGIAGLDRFLPWLVRTASPGEEVLHFVRFLAAFLLFLVPTTLMGGTLPVLARALIREETHLGRRAALLYGSNTLGAAAGTFAAGYLLLPRFGLGGSSLAGVLLNLGVSALALAVSARGASRERAAPEEGAPTGGGATTGRTPPGPDAAPSGRDPRASVFVLAYAISGFAALSLEVVWTKVLSLVVGTTTYAFSAMLTVFLLGLALGSFLVSFQADSRARSPRLLYGIFLGIAAFSGLSLFVLGRLPVAYMRHFELLGTGWSAHQALFFLVSVVVLLPSTMLLGATFALTTRVAVRGLPRMGESLGRLYAMNTVGSVLGALATGLLFIPLMGRQRAGALAVSLYLVVAGLVALALRARWSPRERALALAGFAGAALVASLGLPAWDLQVLASGPYVYFRQYRALGGGLRDYLANVRILDLREEPEAITTVVTSGDYRYLKINGKSDASDEQDMETQRMLAYVPFAYRPDARRALVIGLGSGVTAGSALHFPLEKLVVAEMLEGVRDAARRHFGHVNGDCLDDPRLHLFLGDGRNLLLLDPARYDVVISEPSNPWISGMGSLFTRENFELAARRLEPGGVLCQWVQTYQLRPEDLRDVLGTLRSVFPHVHLWGNMEDLLVVAGREPLRIPAGPLVRGFANPAVRGELARLGIVDPAAFLSYHLADTEGVDRILRPGHTGVTDDNLRLEYVLPRNLFGDYTASVAEEIGRGLGPVAPHLDLADLAPPDAEALLAKISRTDAADPRYYRALARVGWGWEVGRKEMEAVLTAAPDHAPARGRYYFWMRAHGEDLYGQGRCAEAGELLSRVLESGPATDAYGAALLLGDCALREGHPAVAESLWARAAAIHPLGASAAYNLGLAYQEMGRPDRARRAFERAYQINPLDPDTRARLGLDEKGATP